MSLNANKQENQKKILIIIVCVIILYVDFNYLLKAQTKNLNSIAPKISRLKNDLNNLTRDLNNMRELKKKQASSVQKAIIKSTRVISETQIIDLLQDISDLANKNNVKITQIRPLREVPGAKLTLGSEKFLPLFIHLELVCDYHNLGRFINQLENAQVFMVVQEFKIQAQPADYLKQKVMLVLRTYVNK